jgi:cellulose synthase/poly-beta-1,6-N-acetylglucosamine synthase-like glycosyltransferase
MDVVLKIYEYIVFFYAFLLVVIYSILMILSYFKTKKYLAQKSQDIEKIIFESPFTPGISIVAPAYNEEVTIINNVSSMLTVNYPNFEVVIVNDGSKDKTLDLLIEFFEMVETPYAYVEKIKTKPFKRIFKSTNLKYSKLIVVDKENGGTKADASNAGVNVAKHPYFICTDVDCVLERNALINMMQPILKSKIQIIAVGATMRMVNSCEVEKGVMKKTKLPKGIIPIYQEIEYLRSYLVGKTGFSSINAVHNVSGGLGLFDKEVVISAGGYDPLSHAEDMDMITRMIAYMINYQKPYIIEQIPETCCWTEGPPTLKVLNRQRTRWARGLLQIFTIHRKYLFNKDYKKMGLITFPYVFLCEFIAPIIEATGFVFTIVLLIVDRINFGTAWIMVLFMYTAGLTLSFITICYERKIDRMFTNREYFRLGLYCLVEPIIYHPLIVFFSIKGYIDFLTKKNFEWGQMTRQGSGNNTTSTTTSATTEEVMQSGIAIDGN